MQMDKYSYRAMFDIEIDFQKSKGSRLFDKKTGKEYIDFFMMYSSLPLGYNSQVFNKSFQEKVDQVSRQKVANSVFYTEEFEDFVKIFLTISPLKNLHFCNTGALAVESALKCAIESTSNPSGKIIYLKNAFHGINSWGLVTDSNSEANALRLEGYPRQNWICSDLDNAISYIKSDNSVCAFIYEPIQCTAGDIYLSKERLMEIRSLCYKKNICFIADEIQTGFGSTGVFWKSVADNLDPDIIIFGKKSQVAGIMARDNFFPKKLSQNFKLGVTFDGDLIDAIRATYVMHAIRDLNLLDSVKQKSTYLKEAIANRVLNYRSEGFLIAFDFESKLLRDNFFKIALSKGIIVNPTGQKTVRMRPNLALTTDELNEFISRFYSIG